MIREIMIASNGRYNILFYRLKNLKKEDINAILIEPWLGDDAFRPFDTTRVTFLLI